MQLNTLKPAPGAVKDKKRIGRGQGSGKGGTSTRGHKGAKSRSGYKRKRGFEGGQLPLQWRLPRYGFKNPTRIAYKPINLEMLQQLAAPSAELLPAAEVPQLDTLEMRFSENCWIDVVDADGNRVAYGTKQAGYIMQLTGTAPFVVTLGNPSVVKINFNQQAFDMSAFPGGRVAKFTIPESE